ncbi:MAG TPA: cell envelope integrity protein TolA [Gammaproteobacteria bacterium]|nr:cell envelope integrity protein TolA [Gammaproteobacteria bacterium]
MGELPGRLRALVGRPRYLVYAIVVHAAFFAVLVVSLDWTVTPPPPTPNIVQAVAVDEAKVQAEMEKLRRAEERKRKKAQEIERRRRQEEKRLRELRKKRAAEQRRLKEQERKRKAEAKRLAELKRKKEAEKRRLAELEKKKAAEQRRLAEEEKRKEAAARKAALKREQEELERKRKAEEARRRKLAEEELKKQLAAEEARRIRSVVGKYVEIIKQQVERNWLRPPGSAAGLSCQVQVRLIPGGEVVDVQILRGSGDAAFDDSVQKAVLRASPLPLPPDPALFEHFRELKFIFKPEE